MTTGRINQVTNFTVAFHSISLRFPFSHQHEGLPFPSHKPCPKRNHWKLAENQAKPSPRLQPSDYYYTQLKPCLHKTGELTGPSQLLIYSLRHRDRHILLKGPHNTTFSDCRLLQSVVLSAGQSLKSHTKKTPKHQCAVAIRHHHVATS